MISLTQQPKKLGQQSRDLLLRAGPKIKDQFRIAPDFGSYMVSKGILTEPQLDSLVLAQKSLKQQYPILVDLISQNCTDLTEFREACKKFNYCKLESLLQPSTYLLMKPLQPEDKEHIDTVLAGGGVPLFPPYYVPRPKLVHQLKQLLANHSEQTTVFVIHGMLGMGKSTVVMEALRTSSFVGDSGRFRRVFWQKIGREVIGLQGSGGKDDRTASVGCESDTVGENGFDEDSANNMGENSVHSVVTENVGRYAGMRGGPSGSAASGSSLTRTVDHVQLLKKLRILMTKLQSSLPIQATKLDYSSIEEVLERIRQALIGDFPNCLLVLDDVPSKEVARFLNFGYPTIITTNDEGVAEVFSGNVVKMKVDKGFTLEESMDLFAKALRIEGGSNNNDYTKIVGGRGDAVKEVGGKPEDAILPYYEDAKRIHSKVDGLPFAVNVVAGYVAAGVNSPDASSRWRHCLESLPTIKSDSHNQYSKLDQLAEISFSGLDETERRRFSELAVFELGAKINVDCLRTYWSDLKPAEIDQLLDQFRKQHLIYHVNDEQTSSGYFELHNIIHHYLKRKTSEATTQALHRKLIDRYLDRFGGRYENFPNDHYIHWNVGRHLRKADRTDQLGLVYLNLRFLQAASAVCGAGQTLVDFVKYSRFFPDTLDSLMRRLAIQQFLSFNTVQPEELDVDFFQSAMLRPVQSAVYREGRQIAMELIRDHPDSTFYVYLCNHSLSSYSMVPIFSLKPHESKIYRLCYLSRDGSPFVISCSSDGYIHSYSLATSKRVWSHKCPDGCYPRCVDVHPRGNSLVFACGNMLYVPDLQLETWKADYQSVGDTGSLGSQESNSAFSSSFVTSRIIGESSFASDSVDGMSASIPSFDRKDGRSGPSAGGAELSKTPLLKHNGRIRCCEFSHVEGKHIVSCGDDGIVCHTNFKRDRIEKVFEAHSTTITCCRFSNDNKHIITSGVDGKCCVWRVKDFKLAGEYLGHGHRQVLWCICVPGGPYRDCVASMDEYAVLFWSMTSLERQLAVNQLVIGIDDFHLNCMTVSPQGDYLALVVNINIVVIMDLTTSSKPFRLLNGHAGRVTTLKFYSQNELNLLSGGEDGTILSWSVGEAFAVPIPNYKPSLVFTDGLKFGNDHGLTLIYENKPKKLVVLDNKGTELCSKTVPQTIVLIDSVPQRDWGILATKDFECFKFRLMQEQSISVHITNMSELPISGMGDISPAIIAPPSPEKEKVALSLSSLGQHKALRHIAFSSDGSLYALTGGNSVKVFEKDAVSPIIDYKQHDGVPFKAIFLPLKTFKILSVSEVGRNESHSIAIWNYLTGDTLWLSGLEYPCDCDVDSSGEFVVACAEGQLTIKVWSTSDTDPLDEHTIDFKGAMERELKLASEQSGEGGNSQDLDFQQFSAKAAIRCVQFMPKKSPDEESVVAVTGDYVGYIFLWTIPDCDLIMSLNIHGLFPASQLSFSADQRYLTTIAGSCIRWWYVGDWETVGAHHVRRKSIQRFGLHGPITNSRLAVSRDFRHFTTIDHFGNLYILERVLPESES